MWVVMEKKKSGLESDVAGGLVFVGALRLGIGLGIGFVLFGLIKVFV